LLLDPVVNHDTAGDTPLVSALFKDIAVAPGHEILALHLLLAFTSLKRAEVCFHDRASAALEFDQDIADLMDIAGLESKSSLCPLEEF
jgi:hypothetical protein